MKVVTVVGARPQFVKAATVSAEIVRRARAGERIQEVLVHTGYGDGKAAAKVVDLLAAEWTGAPN